MKKSLQLRTTRAHFHRFMGYSTGQLIHYHRLYRVYRDEGLATGIKSDAFAFAHSRANSETEIDGESEYVYLSWNGLSLPFENFLLAYLLKKALCLGRNIYSISSKNTGFISASVYPE